MSLPILYVPPSRYSNSTPAALPIIVLALNAGAVMGLEWTSLKFIEDAPLIVRATTFVVALLMLGVIQSRDWLNFKKWWYFGASIIILSATWLSVSLVAYLYFAVPTAPSPLDGGNAPKIQAQLAKIIQERDAAQQQLQAALQTREFIQRDLQGELGATKQRLFADERRLDAMGIGDSMNPPIINPYPDGPIFQDKFTHAQAEKLINSLVELNDVEETTRHLELGLMLYSDSIYAPTWEEYIKTAGIDNVVQQLQETAYARASGPPKCCVQKRNAGVGSSSSRVSG